MMAGRAIKSCYSSVLVGVRGNVGPLLPDSMAEIAVDVVSTASSSSSLCTRGQVRAMSTASSQQPNRRTRISGNWLVVDEGIRARHVQRARISSSIRRRVGGRASLDLSQSTIVPLALLNVQSIRSLSTLSEFDDALIITSSCVKRIKQLQREAQNANLHLRVLVNGGGCSGFMYSFEMEDVEPDEEDRVFSKEDCKVVVDSSSFELLRGSTIDFTVEMIRSAFTVRNNPQSESACGCGSSFAVKNFSSNPALD